MRLQAASEQKKISLVGEKSLKFIENDFTQKTFQSCFYEIGIDENDEKINRTEKNNSNLKIILTFTKLKNMNVYIYEG